MRAVDGPASEPRWALARAIAVGVLAASAGLAAADRVEINFEDQFPDPFNRPAILDDELSGDPYYIYFEGEPDLVGVGDVEANARLRTSEIMMRAADGYVFNNFDFEIEIEPWFDPQTVTVEVETMDGQVRQFGQYTGNGILGGEEFFFPSITEAAGYEDIVAIRVYDTGRLFSIDNLAYDVAAVPLPHPAALAGLGLVGVIGVRRLRRR